MNLNVFEDPCIHMEHIEPTAKTLLHHNPELEHAQRNSQIDQGLSVFKSQDSFELETSQALAISIVETSHLTLDDPKVKAFMEQKRKLKFNETLEAEVAHLGLSDKVKEELADNNSTTPTCNTPVSSFATTNATVETSRTTSPIENKITKRHSFRGISSFASSVIKPMIGLLKPKEKESKESKEEKERRSLSRSQGGTPVSIASTSQAASPVTTSPSQLSPSTPPTISSQSSSISLNRNYASSSPTPMSVNSRGDKSTGKEGYCYIL